MKTFLTLCILSFFIAGCCKKTDNQGATTDSGSTTPASTKPKVITGGNLQTTINTPGGVVATPIQLNTGSTNAVLVTCYFTGNDFPDARVRILNNPQTVPNPTFIKAGGAGVQDGTVVINPNNAKGYIIIPSSANPTQYTIRIFSDNEATPYDAEADGEVYLSADGHLEYSKFTYTKTGAGGANTVVVMITDAGIYPPQ